MDLQITGIGRYIDRKSKLESGLIVINEGLIIIPVNNEHLNKIVPYFADTPTPTQQVRQPSPPSNPKDEFYVDPTFITDEEAQRQLQEEDDTSNIVDDNIDDDFAIKDY